MHLSTNESAMAHILANVNAGAVVVAGKPSDKD
jgi:hypothetical protein